jgi:hypothetical protein
LTQKHTTLTLFVTVHRFRGSTFSPAAGKKTAGQIEKETDERSICLLFNLGPAIEAASLIIKNIVPFWPSFIQGFRPDLTFLLLTPDT